MPALEPAPDADLRSDADLILAIREGDAAAIDELYRRHHRAALAFAESLAGRSLAPDLVSDAFLRIIDLLKRGGGPTQVFRSYLYTTVRNLYVDHVRHHSRQTSLPDFGPLEAELALGDGVDDHFEHSLVKRAFSALPERWQVALWYTTVEGVSLEDTGKYLGVAPNAVAALTFRAREGLRQAYLAEHLSLSVDGTCAEVWEVLPKYVRGALGARMRETVEGHLPECRGCSTAVLELGEVNSNLRGVLLIGLLGTATAGYLERALGGDPAPTSVPAPTGPRGFGRVAAAVGTAAAAGVLVLAWPHHGSPGTPGESRGAAPTLAQSDHPSSGRAPDRGATPVGAPVVPGPGRIDPVSFLGSTRTSPQSAGRVVLGTPTVTRLTSSTPSWFHVDVPVSAPDVAPNDLALVVTLPAGAAFHVHREPGSGPWSCAVRDGGGAQLVSCRLPDDADALALGLDVRTADRVRVLIGLSSSVAGSTSTEVGVG